MVDVLLLGLDVQFYHIHYSTTTHLITDINYNNNDNVTSIKEYSLLQLTVQLYHACIPRFYYYILLFNRYLKG